MSKSNVYKCPNCKEGTTENNERCLVCDGTGKLHLKKDSPDSFTTPSIPLTDNHGNAIVKYVTVRVAHGRLQIFFDGVEYIHADLGTHGCPEKK